MEEEGRAARKAGKEEGEETGEGVAKVDEEAAACSQSPWQTRGQSARGAPSSDSSRQNVEALRRRSRDEGTRSQSWRVRNRDEVRVCDFFLLDSIGKSILVSRSARGSRRALRQSIRED